MYGLPDYSVTKFLDSELLHQGIVESNLEKSHIRYIRGFLELECAASNRQNK